MRVLIAHPWDNIGGVCQVVNRVARHLQRQGHAVHLLLGGDRGLLPEPTTSREGFPAFRMYLRSPNVPDRPVKSGAVFGATFPLTMSALVALVRRLGIDVVNVHYPGESGIYFSMLRRCTRIRLVTSIHGADLLPNGTPPERYPIGVRSVLDRSDLLVAPSEPYRDSVQAALPFLRTPIRVIPNGVDVDELRRDETPAAAGGEPPFVLSILQMVHYKGVDILIRAFAALHRHYPELRLKLVSDGPQRESFEQLAASLGVRDRVDFLGWLGRERIVPLLHGCSFFVLPSRTNSESFGIAAAEALACDRAVIASRIGGLPALIEDGLTGLLVPPGDIDALEGAMRRLLDSPELRASLGRAGGDRVRTQFTWERTGEGYERALGGLLAERPLAAREPVLVP